VTRTYVRLAATLGAAIVLLAGCGDSQPATDKAPGGVKVAQAKAIHAGQDRAEVLDSLPKPAKTFVVDGDDCMEWPILDAKGAPIENSALRLCFDSSGKVNLRATRIPSS